MARGDWDSFEKWATEHALDFEAPDVQDVYYTWVEIFSSDPILSDQESLDAFRAFLELSGFDDDEIEDIIDTYAHE
jgi:hypothetical protein